MQTTPEATSYLCEGRLSCFFDLRGAEGLGQVFSYFRPTLYISQWFLDVQRNLPWDALLTVGYIGTKGTHLHNIRNINLPQTPSATVARRNERYFRPQFGAISLHENSLNSNSYNSLTAKVEKRFSKGLTLLSSFTWSHAIDQGNEDLLDGGSGGVTPWDMSRERSNSNVDRRRATRIERSVRTAVRQGPHVPHFRREAPPCWAAGSWAVFVEAVRGSPSGTAST
ncbi:MAG: hypothetical protein QM757_14905 [Paludibaculum sp.]